MRNFQCRGPGPCSQRSLVWRRHKEIRQPVNPLIWEGLQIRGRGVCVENREVEGSGLKKSVPGDPERRVGTPGTATPEPSPCSCPRGRVGRERAGLPLGLATSQPVGILLNQLLFQLVKKMKLWVLNPSRFGCSWRAGLGVRLLRTGVWSCHLLPGRVS